MNRDSPTIKSKIARTVRQDGIVALVKRGIPYVWNQVVASRLLKQTVQYNGILIKKEIEFASLDPRASPHRPKYESGTISALTQQVQEGDTVVIVGGGWGVTATAAAKRVGASGEVTVYEGASSEVSKIGQTAVINGIANRISIEHAVVGPEVSLRGQRNGAQQVPPEQLPSCDILELDCEGAEIDIIENIDSDPRVVIVESHGFLGSSSSEIQEILREKGYAITSKEVADKGVRETCKSKDIYVITAIYSGE